MARLTSATTTGQYDLGLQAFKAREYEHAVTTWLMAADEASPEDARKIADGLSAVASVWLRNNRTDSKTEQLFVRAIELRQAFLAENDESIAIEFNNLGMFYDRVKTIDKAIDCLSKAIAILDTHPVLNKENYADPYDNLATVLFDRGDLDRAHDLCRRSLEIRDHAIGKINPLSLKGLELLAAIQDAIKPHSRAARETRKEYKARLVLLSVAYEKLGDPLLSQALLVSSQLGGRQAEDMLSTSLSILCQDYLKNRRP